MARLRLKKDVREIVEWAEARGWVLCDKLDGRTHHVLRHRNGAKISIPSTTSDRRRNRANAMAKMKRLARGLQR